jgi:hypothetical protein
MERSDTNRKRKGDVKYNDEQLHDEGAANGPGYPVVLAFKKEQLYNRKEGA